MRPNTLRPERASPGDLAHCRAMIRTGSRSFYAASLLLPQRVRAGAYALYAFCRFSDDSVDVEGGGMEAVDALQRRLDAVYAGAPKNSAIDRALADSVERFAIPRAPFDALLEGLAWDAEARRCSTLSDLYAYSARVAGAVGAMMAALMGARSPDLVARACDLGVAMQLTNVARDVGEDARRGRLYLPLDWLAEAGVDAEALLAEPRFTPALAGVVERLLSHADALYKRADAGIAALPAAFRPAIAAARLLYAEIGEEVRRRGCNSIASRSVIPIQRKIALAARAYVRSAPRAAKRLLTAPPLAEALFLVEAQAQPDRAGDRELATDLEWVIDLFAALDKRPHRVA